MPMQNGIYVAPTWVNNAAPAIDADELQAMSDTIQENQTPGVAKVQLTQALQSAFGLSSSQQLDALLNILSRAAVLNSGGDELQSVLGDTLLTLPGVRIATGSYVGTGTYGANNPCTLTFDFLPELVMFQNTFFGQISTGGSSSNIVPVMAMQGQTNGMVFYNSASGADGYTYITWSNKTMSWYNTSDEYYQLNSLNTTYYYLAFGR